MLAPHTAASATWPAVTMCSSSGTEAKLDSNQRSASTTDHEEVSDWRSKLPSVNTRTLLGGSSVPQPLHREWAMGTRLPLASVMEEMLLHSARLGQPASEEESNMWPRRLPSRWGWHRCSSQ